VRAGSEAAIEPEPGEPAHDAREPAMRKQHF
jgi:hypothetical protein